MMTIHANPDSNHTIPNARHTASQRVRPGANMSLATLLLRCAAVAALMGHARAHGCMNTPNQRGTLSARTPFVTHVVDAAAPSDFKPHFPAGDKTATRGAALRSQIAAAGPPGWVTFTPLHPSFRWRAGVCGDALKPVAVPGAHMRGGEYYYGGKVVATYRQASAIGVGFTINAHHNGFMEMHVCDVSKCGGEISQACFRRGHCTMLRRAPNAECDKGDSMRCGPIDRRFPGRWYLPCSKYPLDDFMRETIAPRHVQYLLPQSLRCTHCVLQWYWTAANTCNPPGLYDYFTGPDRPLRWLRSQCRGQGGAVGGFAARRQTCGGSRFPEEYLQCADIRIDPRPNLAAAKPRTSSTPRKRQPPLRKQPTSPRKRPTSPRKRPAPRRKRPTPPRARPPTSASGGHKAIRDLRLVARNRDGLSLYGLGVVNVTRFGPISVQAVAADRVDKVAFFVDGRLAHVAREPPFYIRGTRPDGAFRAWRGFKTGRLIKIAVVGEKDHDSVMVKFVK